MINRIIDFSAQNRFWCSSAWPPPRWPAGVDAHSAGCHPRSQRHAGDRLFALGPQPGHRGRPGDLSDRQRHAGRAEGEGGPRVLRFRLFVRLHHLRGGHRYLLGALAHAGVSLRRVPRLPKGQDRTRSRCDRLGLGLPVCAGGHRAAPAWRSCARCRTGICAIT